MDPPIHSHVFACYERGVLKIEHCVDDVRDLTHSTEGMELRQRRMIILGVHRRVDVAGRHRVEPDVVRCVLQCQSLTYGWHRRFRKHRQKSRHAAARLIREDCRDVHYMPRLLLLHLRDHLLRHEEVAGHIGVHYQIVVVLGVLGERLGNENACVVNQQVDTAEMLDCCLRYFDGGFLLADVTVDEDEID